MDLLKRLQKLTWCVEATHQRLKLERTGARCQLTRLPNTWKTLQSKPGWNTKGIIMAKDILKKLQEVKRTKPLGEGIEVDYSMGNYMALSARG